MSFLARASFMDVWSESTISHFMTLLALFVSAIAIGIPVLFYKSKKSNFALVNPPTWREFYAQKQLDWLKNGLELMSRSRSKLKGKPYRVITELGEMTVLPSGSGEWLKAEPSMNFRLAVSDVSIPLTHIDITVPNAGQDFHAHLPGFEPFALLDHKSEFLQKVVRKQLTKQLSQ